MHQNVVRNSNQKRVNKSWGYEEWIANSPLYCGKKLVINSSCTSSLHFHIQKTEHIYVHEGCLTIEILEDKERQMYRLDAGDSILIEPGMMHRLCNYDPKPLVLFEFSTEHFDEDSYRIE